MGKTNIYSKESRKENYKLQVKLTVIYLKDGEKSDFSSKV